jgi:hypothetical protein
MELRHIAEPRLLTLPHYVTNHSWTPVSITSSRFTSLTMDGVVFAVFLLEAYPGVICAVLGDATPAIQTLRIHPKFFMIREMESRNPNKMKITRTENT